MRGLLQQIVVLALGNVSTTVVEVKRRAIGGVIASVFFLTAYVALVMALAFFVAAEAGPVAASLVVAGAAMAAALVVLAVVAVLNRQTERRMLERQAALAARGPDPLTGRLIAELPVMMRDSPIVTTIMVGSLVYVLARSRGFGRGRRD